MDGYIQLDMPEPTEPPKPIEPADWTYWLLPSLDGPFTVWQVIPKHMMGKPGYDLHPADGPTLPIREHTTYIRLIFDSDPGPYAIDPNSIRAFHVSIWQNFPWEQIDIQDLPLKVLSRI